MSTTRQRRTTTMTMAARHQLLSSGRDGPEAGLHWSLTSTAGPRISWRAAAAASERHRVPYRDDADAGTYKSLTSVGFSPMGNNRHILHHQHVCIDDQTHGNTNGYTRQLRLLRQCTCRARASPGEFCFPL